jgi:hypothetical protein
VSSTPQQLQQSTQPSHAGARSSTAPLLSSPTGRSQGDGDGGGGGPTVAVDPAVLDATDHHVPSFDSEEKENSQQHQLPAPGNRSSWSCPPPQQPPCLKDVMDLAPSRSASWAPTPSQPQELPPRLSAYTRSQEAEASRAVAQVLAGMTTTTTKAAPTSRLLMHPPPPSPPYGPMEEEEDEEPITEYE